MGLDIFQNLQQKMVERNFFVKKNAVCFYLSQIRNTGCYLINYKWNQILCWWKNIKAEFIGNILFIKLKNSQGLKYGRTEWNLMRANWEVYFIIEIKIIAIF